MDMKQIDVPLADLVLSQFNVRKNLEAGQEDANIDDLARCIEENGLLSPLIVRQADGGKYEVLSGQRRLMACERVGVRSIPCRLRENSDDDDAVTVSLVENVQRADMHPLDKARALKRLYDIHQSYDAVARQTGWSKQTVKKYLDLLSLPESLQARLGTAGGATSIGALSGLAAKFKGEDAIAVFDQISGFNGKLQTEIIKRSGGDIGRIGCLVAEAQEGAFDMQRCDSEVGCQVLRSIITGEISRTEFESMVQQVADELETNVIASGNDSPVRKFWKALAKDL